MAACTTTASAVTPRNIFKFAIAAATNPATHTSTNAANCLLATMAAIRPETLSIGGGEKRRSAQAVMLRPERGSQSTSPILEKSRSKRVSSSGLSVAVVSAGSTACATR